MQRICVLFFLCFPGFLASQVSISGVINTYTAVSSLSTCAATLTVADTSGFQIGGRVLLIQMQGAEIDETDSPAYGNMLNLQSAGRYEFGRIAAVTNTEIFLQDQLLHTYDPAGGLQLITVPEYSSAQVTEPLTAQPWDGTTGGVVVLSVSDTLSLQADVDVSAAGFRAGPVQNPESDCFWLLNQDNYFYPADNWRGAWKGEGVAAWIPGKELGRGPQANGGGGGNDHNSGGGGGSHFSEGGSGGEQDPPSVFGCTGDYPGLAGRMLSDTARLHPGGAGGTGHTDDAGAGSAGGRGGGILIVETSLLLGNSFALRADGASATDAGGDGAGGGGAGGSVVLLADDWSGPLIVSARGGDGGDTNNPSDRCFGPGGGGSGGRVLTNLNDLPAPDLAGGSAGVNTTSSGNCSGPSNGAEAGNSGITGLLSALPEGAIPAGPPQVTMQPIDSLIACADQLDTLFLAVTGSDLTYQWQANTDAGFVDLSDGALYGGTQTDSLIFLSPGDVSAGTLFRCIVTSDCHGELISDSTLLILQALPTGNLLFNQSGNEVDFSAQVSEGELFNWAFGDGETGTGPMVSHTYDEDGVYVVELTVENACGGIVLTDTVFVGAPPTAGFIASLPGGCAPVEIQFTDQSTGSFLERMWSFPGGDPTSSTEANPTVLYTEPGSYDVSLIVSSPLGTDTLSLPGSVEVLQTPEAQFAFSISGDTVFFENQTTGDFASVQWVFGDGAPPSNEFDPVHVFPGEGVYEVTLSVTNAYCGSFITIPVEIVKVSTTDPSACHPRIWPNPTEGLVNLEACFPTLQVELRDAMGRPVLHIPAGGTSETVDLSHLPAGWYYVMFRHDSQFWVERLLLTGE